MENKYIPKKFEHMTSTLLSDEYGQSLRITRHNSQNYLKIHLGAMIIYGDLFGEYDISCDNEWYYLQISKSSNQLSIFHSNLFHKGPKNILIEKKSF